MGDKQARGGGRKEEGKVFDRIYRMDRISVGGGIFTTEGTENTEKNREEGLEEIARRYLLQPVGGFPPG